jgi:hypothetical protein
VRYALILANLRREGPMLVYVAMTDCRLYYRSFSTLQIEIVETGPVQVVFVAFGLAGN